MKERSKESTHMLGLLPILRLEKLQDSGFTQPNNLPTIILEKQKQQINPLTAYVTQGSGCATPLT